MTQGPTLESLADDLQSGRTSSRALVEECLARIDDPRGQGGATFIHVDRDGAMAQGDAIDALRRRSVAPSRYAGIPISIKDLFDIAGQPTRAGSLVLAGATPALRDADAVARLRQAGFVLIGRTNMSEFAFSGLGLNPHYGTPLNPWDRANPRVPGGSSSGAAVSVTDGMAYAALGTDTGGSCRIPAAFTGLTGFKPTAHRVPTAGAIPLSKTLDSVGPIARSVRCCETIDAILSGETAPARSDDIAPGLITLALVRNYVLEGLDAAVAVSFERAVSDLSRAGFRVCEITLPAIADLPEINRKGGFPAAESFAWHEPLLASSNDLYDPRVCARIMRGAGQSASDYLRLTSRRASLIASVTDDLRDFDVAIMPTTPTTAPRVADTESDEAFAALNMLALRNPSIVNMIDGCAVSLPASAIGEPPVGLTVFGLRGSDRGVLRTAKSMEKSLGRGS